MACGGSDSVKNIILKELRRNKVKPEDIPEDPYTDPSNLQHVRRSNRYFRCKAFASFDSHEDPTGGGHRKTWKSAHAWCTIDLKQQQITHRWSQKCNKCNGESYPFFDERALQRMAEYAVKMYLINIGKIEREEKEDDDDDDNPLMGPPHDEDRCSMCQMLGCSCWKKRKKYNNQRLDIDIDAECYKCGDSEEENEEYTNADSYYDYDSEDDYDDEYLHQYNRYGDIHWDDSYYTDDD